MFEVELTPRDTGDNAANPKSPKTCTALEVSAYSGVNTFAWKKKASLIQDRIESFLTANNTSITAYIAVGVTTMVPGILRTRLNTTSPIKIEIVNPRYAVVSNLKDIMRIVDTKKFRPKKI